MERDQKRVQQALDHIRRIKSGDYPVMVGVPGNYRIEERPWGDLAESSKLAILQDAVDWSSISNRDQAHILLGAIDPGKITDAQRNHLIGMATGVSTKTVAEILDMTTDAQAWFDREQD